MNLFEAREILKKNGYSVRKLNECGGRGDDLDRMVYDSGACGYITRRQQIISDYERHMNSCGAPSRYKYSDEEIVASNKRIDAYLNSPEYKEEQKAYKLKIKQDVKKADSFYKKLKDASSHAISAGMKTVANLLPDNMTIDTYTQKVEKYYRELRIVMTVDGISWIVKYTWKAGKEPNENNYSLYLQDKSARVKGGRGKAENKIKSAIKPVIDKVSDVLKDAGYFKKELEDGKYKGI